MSRPTLYEQVLGANYTRLPPAVQRFHELRGRTVLHGWVQTDAPSSAPARFLAYCLGTPRGRGCGPLRFEIDAEPDAETWIRRFPARTMTSRLRRDGGQLEERLGAVRLAFDLAAADGMLKMELARMRVLGIPCPRWLMPRIVAEESGAQDELRFRIVAALALIGVVASYRGTLDLGSKETS